MSQFVFLTNFNRKNYTFSSLKIIFAFTSDHKKYVALNCTFAGQICFLMRQLVWTIIKKRFSFEPTKNIFKINIHPFCEKITNLYIRLWAKKSNKIPIEIFFLARCGCNKIGKNKNLPQEFNLSPFLAAPKECNKTRIPKRNPIWDVFFIPDTQFGMSVIKF